VALVLGQDLKKVVLLALKAVLVLAGDLKVAAEVVAAEVVAAEVVAAEDKNISK
jgi:hypothetical protein